jgi:hypothetical protein
MNINYFTHYFFSFASIIMAITNIVNWVAERIPRRYSTMAIHSIALRRLRCAVLFGVAVVLFGCASTEVVYVPHSVDAGAEGVCRAFAAAYGERVGYVVEDAGNWTMLVAGERFSYAHGRLLPAALRDKWQNYTPYDFYQYPWRGSDAERKAAEQHPIYSIGSSFLFDALYGIHDSDSAWEAVVKASFLGVHLLVHPAIVAPLARVEAACREAAKTDAGVREWIAEIQTNLVGGWIWRPIAGTARRSTHAYGIALDLLPAALDGRATYWRWGDEGKGRYEPPALVVRAFERCGFIWGGKWDLVDTMHFEYRPEMLLLNGLPVNGIDRVGTSVVP